jgi:Domain of unknown function (DUF2431)
MLYFLLFQKEGDDPVSLILDELREARVRVKYGVDATKLVKGLKANKKHGGLKPEEIAFDRVVFNFPHTGLGIKDQVDIGVPSLSYFGCRAKQTRRTE